MKKKNLSYEKTKYRIKKKKIFIQKKKLYV